MQNFINCLAIMSFVGLALAKYRYDKKIKYLEGNIKHIEEYLKNKTV